LHETVFLDANIYLELPFPEESYFDECEELFSNDSVKKTSVRVNDEVERVLRNRLQVIPDLIRHFQRNGKKKFIPPRELKERTLEFTEEVLEYVGNSDSKTVIRRLRELLAFLGKSVESRLQRTDKRLIPYSVNDTLYGRLVPYITNQSDAWHVVDASEWAKGNGEMTFCTIDTDILKPASQLVGCLCNYYGVIGENCPLFFSHIVDLMKDLSQ
jgi:hypothetical protein